MQNSSNAEDLDAARIVAIDLEVQQSWQGSENGGWHASWDKLQRDRQNASALQEEYARNAEDETNWIVNKLMLAVSELAEAQDELRDGHGVTEVYYSDPTGLFGSPKAKYKSQRYGSPSDPWSYTLDTPRPGDVPLLKPEGFLVEVADAVIRLEDLVGIVTEGKPSFGKIKLEKISYNATRGQMHGGRKF